MGDPKPRNNGVSTWQSGYHGGDFEFSKYETISNLIGFEADMSLAVGVSFGDLGSFKGKGTGLAFDLGLMAVDVTFDASQRVSGIRIFRGTDFAGGISQGDSNTTTSRY
ncbi:hypothetical protein [Agarilytica rhodophyticola]|uniref:hypothetical protein n=1 Tax=Agarilytica rhodophyticola TaxID=1737490 RepID=UPI000B343A5B|nr:hypothetical protein [Agarilytica rhodophyticola]